MARKPTAKRPRAARRPAGDTIEEEENDLEYARQAGLEPEEPYEEDEGYVDKLEDEEPENLEAPEDAEDYEGGWREQDGDIDDLSELPGREEDEEDEGNGNRGARFALDRGFASIDEARRREQRGEIGD